MTYPKGVNPKDCRVRSPKVVISGRDQGDWPDLRVIVPKARICTPPLH
jgi:hypothetical protein